MNERNKVICPFYIYERSPVTNCCENNDNFYKFSNIYIYISYVYRIKKNPSRYKTKSSCLNQNELTGASNT